MSSQTYRVSLDQFEGPLDLLLFFIQRDELDIHDIPVARIADEFLEYVRILEQVDLDGAADFMYMAALLINIKARMLLPSTEVDEDGEPVDPRAELVERLVEYVRYREAAVALAEQFDRRSELFTKGDASHQPEPEREETSLESASVFDLISALRRVLTEADDASAHEVAAEEYSIEQQANFVRTMLGGAEPVSFVTLVRGRSKPFIITTFLAILEMARQGHLAVKVTATAEDFFLESAGTATNGHSGSTNGKKGSG
jgi:segregation and condensation protein A